ncbi:MAG: 1-acyl-sn-glycerol-3-phosphate acyltransferase [Rhodocyclales bacterium]|nr:1-acyl-sn-glycerol-3-phosphate acyltransferase [Rhodocyclales bacterium]
MPPAAPDRRRGPLAGALFAAYETLAMLLGLGMLAAICLAWLPVTLPLSLLPHNPGRRLGRLAIMGSFRFYLWFLGVFCYCRFDLDDLDSLRRDAPLIIVANHPSLLDAVILLSRFPNMVCVMKAALAGNILFGAGARLARYICNDVPLQVILRAREELRDGGQLLLFPEGTRTTEFPVNPCSGSAGLISARTGVPIQALLIEFSTPYLGKAWPLFRRPSLPLRVRVRVGRRFAPPKDVPVFTRELEAYFRDELSAALGPAAECRGERVGGEPVADPLP